MAERRRRLTFLQACTALGIPEEAGQDNDDEIEEEDMEVVEEEMEIGPDGDNDGVVENFEGDMEVFSEGGSSEESSSSEEEEDEDADNNLIAANGVVYSNQPFEHRLRERNIINERPRALVRPATESESFFHFIPEEILRVVLRSTNIKARAVRHEQERHRQRAYMADFSYEELLAGLAICIRAGKDRDNFCSIDDFYCKNDSKPFYRATMSKHRFKFFLRCIRFDDFRSREIRRREDRMAAISDVWQMFLSNLRRVYIPKENLTIDEQLVGYRGRIPGRTYIPSKPRKYGLKIFWLCEAPSGFALNGMMYTGRREGEPIHRNLGMDVVLQLTEPYRGSGRNIVTDNFFTSHMLATRLLANNLTLLGTVRLHRREVPPYIKTAVNREAKTSRFVFDHEQKITLCSYIPKRNKVVLLLSSSHSGVEVSNEEHHKPLMILEYNTTKGGVDTMDENVEEFSVRRKTRRWPLLLFFNMIDVAVNNAFLLKKAAGYTFSKKDFLKKLSFQLGLQYATIRLRRNGIQRHIKDCGVMVGYIEQVDQRVQVQVNRNNPTSCAFCRKTTRSKCDHCMKAICPNHRRIVKTVKCNDCQ